MKHYLYALMALCAFGLLSCRKSSDNFTIQQADANQIQTYIAQNGLTQMKKDTSGGDTTGIYYQIITPGTGKTITYSDQISYVYTLASLDGKFAITDTFINHSTTYGAYVTPNGLQLTLLSILKKKGGTIRALIPSRLAYGTNGTTITTYNNSNSTTITTVGTVAGNQCLDVTVHLIDNDTYVTNGVNINHQNAYDNASILQYIASIGLTGKYTQVLLPPSASYPQYPQGVPTGVYYYIEQPGTGTTPISISSTVGIEYTGSLFDGAIFDSENTGLGTPAINFTLYDVIPAWQLVFPLMTAGAKFSIISPSGQAYGQTSFSSGSGGLPIPAFSCLRFEINLYTVTN